MDNSPEAVKGRVRSMTKAIRYKARKEGNLMKAFNDYMSSASGISATERSMVKKSLGLTENKWRQVKSDWRAELNEIAPMIDKNSEKAIKEKKVKNKIIINPTMGMKEAIEDIGGTIVEMVEIEEVMSPKEIQLQKRKTQIDMQVARERRKQINKASAEPPTKEVGEGYAPGDVDQKVGAVTAIPKKKREAARDRLLAKTKAKREARLNKEETEDSLRDKRMERGGVDGNVRYDRTNRNPERKKSDPKASERAFNSVRDEIIKKYGKGALINTKQKK